jgi:hypothetical protein
MDCQGQVVVANYLGNMSKKGIKGATDSELEMEILKFFKKSLSNKVGPSPVLADCRVAQSIPCRNPKSFTDSATRSHRPISPLEKPPPRSSSSSATGRKMVKNARDSDMS